MGITKDEQMLINEIHRQGRMLSAEARNIALLEARAEVLGNQRALKNRPKAYTLDFSFVPGELVALTKDFTVSGGRFFAHSISTSFSIVGQAAVDDGAGGTNPGQIANLTCGEGGTANGPSARQAFFDFFWSARDTSSDFSLQDVAQPSVVLASGHASPCVLPVPMMLEHGASLEMQIDPFFSRAIPIGGFVKEGILNYRSFRLIVKFWGQEVIA